MTEPTFTAQSADLRARQWLAKFIETELAGDEETAEYLRAEIGDLDTATEESISAILFDEMEMSGYFK